MSIHEQKMGKVSQLNKGATGVFQHFPDMEKPSGRSLNQPNDTLGRGGHFFRWRSRDVFQLKFEVGTPRVFCYECP